MTNDLISRSALIKELDALFTNFLWGIPFIKRIVENAPSVDAVEVVHGEWIAHEGYEECNLCHHKFRLKYNFCPNCGADMRERKGDDAV